MTCVLTARGNLDTDTHTGKIPSEHKDGDHSDASRNPGIPKIASHLPRLGEMLRNRFSRISPGRMTPADMTL